MSKSPILDTLSEQARALLVRLANEPERDVQDIARNVIHWPEDDVRTAASELVKAKLGDGMYFEGGGDEIVVFKLSDRGRLVARGNEHLLPALG